MDLMQYIIENLVDSPDDVRVSEIPGNEEVVLEIRVADPDVGKVIGKNGSVARALRTLLSAVGARSDQNFSLEIID